MPETTMASVIRAFVRLALLLPVAFVVATAGCASLTRNPVPVDQMASAQVPGMPGVRGWGGETSHWLQEDLVQSARDEREDVVPRNPDGSRYYHVLTLSGGGAQGAFGAGFLYGWTEAGTRPKFKIVTGISTGSLIAPFAFLGSEYDGQLKEAFTTITSKNVFEMSLPLFGGEALTSTAPLANLIERYIDEEYLTRAAQAHAAGRRLYMGTTNMDAERLVVWNMGAIAASGHSDALELFRNVMRASASLPILFPPVYFDVEVDGRRYDEMHVDGGIMTQVFFTGLSLDLVAAARDVEAPVRGGSVYVIRNDKLSPVPEPIDRKLIAITGRTIAGMIKTMAVADLTRIYLVTEQVGGEFNYVGIPDDFVWDGREAFDREEMRRLFEVGRELAKSGNPWQTVPPLFDERKLR
jgi:hypothetical protein